MTFGCWLCQVAPGADEFVGDRATVRQHLRDHGIPDDRLEVYLRVGTEEQTTLEAIE